MSRKTTQKRKKWYKPKQPYKHVVADGLGCYHYNGTPYEDTDFFNVNWSSYGGITHKNRDRKGGHIRQNWRNTSNTLPNRVAVKRFHIQEGLEELQDIKQEAQNDLDNWYCENEFEVMWEQMEEFYADEERWNIRDYEDNLSWDLLLSNDYIDYILNHTYK